MPLTMECSRNNVALLIQVAGWVNAETAPELEQVFRQWISPTDKNMILDLTHVEYISSAGLSSVLLAGKEMDKNGGTLRLCGLAGRVLQLFTYSGFNALFPVFVDQQAAIADCRLDLH